MLSNAWQDKIMSQRLLRELREGGREAFVRAHEKSYFLAVAPAIGAENAELLEGLLLMSPDTKSVCTVKALPFKTKAQRGAGCSLAPRANGYWAVDPLDRGCRVLEVGKRGDLDAAFPDRISVGRAANKDIVLRHTSVSKFHAWFGVDETVALYVVDAGSTNHTLVGGRLLTPRTPEPVSTGTEIRFGSIDTLVMDAATLWKVAHGARSR